MWLLTEMLAMSIQNFGYLSPSPKCMKSPSNLFHIYTEESVPNTEFTILMYCLEHCGCFNQVITVKLFCLIINVFCSGHILPVASSLPISAQQSRPVSSRTQHSSDSKNLMLTSRCYLCLFELHNCNYNPIEFKGRRLPYYDNTSQGSLQLGQAHYRSGATILCFCYRHANSKIHYFQPLVCKLWCGVAHCLLKQLLPQVMHCNRGKFYQQSYMFYLF